MNSLVKCQLKRFFDQRSYQSVLMALGTIVVASSSARADVYHYNNVLVGDRANGMGGAYTGIADDASGTYYNPAGIAFAQSNDLSGSANAYYSKSLVYENVLAGQDYKEEASGLFSPFIGILNKLDRFVPGLVGAFSMYTSDTELLNQNDRWPVVATSSTTGLSGFHRTVQLKSSTSHISAALGYRLSGRLSVGLGLRYTMIDELSQDFQKSMAFTVAGETVTQTVRSYTNNRTMLKASAIEPVIGAQMALGQSLSIGLSMRKGTLMAEELTQATDALTVTHEDSGGVNADSQPASSTETTATEDAEVSSPLGSIPGEVRVGVAWFASPRFLVSGDLSYYDPSTKGKVSYLRRESVLNYAVGTEYYMTPSIALRAGAFTNNDSRKKVVSGKQNQLPSIDFNGGSLFLAYIQPNSQISLGAVYQKGVGKAQKVIDADAIQDLTGSISTLSISATTSL